jgi:hypothetical protein
MPAERARPISARPLGREFGTTDRLHAGGGFDLDWVAPQLCTICDVYTVPIRLIQTPTRYRMSHRTEGKSARKHFWTLTDRFLIYTENRDAVQFTSHMEYQGTYR